MEIIKMNIDYEKVRTRDKIIKTKRQYGFVYLKYKNLIVALRLLDWKHRDIVDFLHEEIDDLKALANIDRVDNNKLMRLVSHWRKNNMIDFDEVTKIKEGIANGAVKSANEVKEVNLFSGEEKQNWNDV